MGFSKEPAAWIGFIQVLLALAVGFGLQVTPEQVGLILAAITAASTILIRSQVTPVGSLR